MSCRIKLAIASLLALSLAACNANMMVIGNESGAPRFLETTHLSFEHTFTEAGEESARSRAESECSKMKRVAVQSERGCTLEKCVTHFQCVTPKDAKAYGL